MHQDQGIALLFGDKPDANDGLAHTAVNEDPDVVFAQSIGGLFLDGSEFTVKRTSNGSPGWRWSSMVNALLY